MNISPLSCLIYCRRGFEKEAAAEIITHTQKQNIQGYIKSTPDSGYLEFYPASPVSLTDFNRSLQFKKLIFARQCIFVSEIIKTLPADDRVTPLITSVQSLGLSFNTVYLETPDTNDGKQLSGFCKKFSNPLIRALEKNTLIQQNSDWRLHLFFLNSTSVYIGIAHIKNSSPYNMGIMRLRMPKAAPSRSTLKLEEAIKTMLTEHEQTQYLNNGMSAVDLGACPGGWTWQLVKRSIRVNAIDNGPMDRSLMETGLVNEIKADGFKYLPDKPVDWLVCDMVERPMHIAKLISRWIVAGHCRHAIFNLKLPMKKRYDMVMECKAYIESELDPLHQSYRLSIKHLYHDREEVTCLILFLDNE